MKIFIINGLNLLTMKNTNNILNKLFTFKFFLYCKIEII